MTSDNRVLLVNSDDVNIADAKALGASEGVTVDVSQNVPRGKALAIDRSALDEWRTTA